MKQTQVPLTSDELTSFLNEKALQYENPLFIEEDPIQIPHAFVQKEDIEISGFLTATIAWGNRKSIIKNANLMMEMMGHTPFDFVLHHSTQDLKPLQGFVHRTFNGADFVQFIQSLKNIYSHHNGLENVFFKHTAAEGMQNSISQFKKIFFEIPHPLRTTKHVSDPLKNSAAKRLNMFLRWMVRPAQKGVDFGVWKTISPSKLSCPLDVHTGNVGRKLGLIQRKTNDAKSLKELDRAIRLMDAQDPVKYDFALFGLGRYENF